MEGLIDVEFDIVGKVLKIGTTLPNNQAKALNDMPDIATLIITYEINIIP